jgi:hypothetical protein
MQKVVGSNPISRFEVNPLQVGHSALARENQTTPHIASISGTSARNDADGQGLAAIPADSASLWRGGGAKWGERMTAAS